MEECTVCGIYLAHVEEAIAIDMLSGVLGGWKDHVDLIHKGDALGRVLNRMRLLSETLEKIREVANG